MANIGGVDGRVVFELDADDRKLLQSVANATKTIQKETSKWDDAGSDAAKGVEKSWTSSLRNIGAAIGAAKLGQTLVSLGKEAINLASDLEEVQNVVDVTFGDDAGTIERWAKGARTQFGLTETAAKKFASTMGATLKSSGVDSNLVTEMSTNLAGLAADMASFYNLDFEEAFDKIKSGLTGITMPLKALGINLSENNLSEFAESQGQLYSKLSEAEKIVLRYQYLMTVTADAQGDFARTSDNFANQMRLFETNIETLKTNLGQALIPVANQAMQLINGLLDSLNGVKKVSLADSFAEMFADIDQDTERKMARISETATSAKDLVNVLSGLNGTTTQTGEGEKTFADIFKEISEITASGGDASAYIQGLGLSVEDTTRDYNVWLETMQRLNRTIPGINSLLNAQTGEIDGGTDALIEYIDAWQKAQEAAAIGAAFERKGSIITQMENAVADAKADYLVVLAQYNRLQQEIDAEARKQAEIDAGNLGISFDELVAQNPDWLEKYRSIAEYTSDIGEEYLNVYTNLITLEAEWRTADDTLKQTKQDLEDGKQAFKELYGVGTDGAEDLTKELSTLEKAILGDTNAAEELKNILDSVATVSEKIADIHQNTWDETAKSVDSVIDGFSKLVTPAEKARKEMVDLEKELANAKEGAEGEIQIKITKANDDIQTIGKMTDAMQDQIDYMNRYQQLIADLRSRGVADDILAAFATGSMEDYDVLAGLMYDTRGEVTSGEQLEEWIAKYRERETIKQGFTAGLTDTKLSGNAEYQQLLTEEEELLNQLDKAAPAEDAAERTVAGIAQGIGAALPSVTAQVNAVLEQISRLANLGGYTFGSDFFGGNSTFTFTGSGNPSAWLIPSHATGLDRVPYDGYLAMLHEGEAVLTAQEARMWRGMNYRSNSIDYDALGGVMRDNVQAGGNVYLEGRTVGRVLSAVQADSYRGLERSGWQG